MSSTCSCGALGTSTYVCPPSGLAPVACPCVDVDAALDVPAVDVPEDRPAPVDVVDAPSVDAVDAGADVVAVADAVALEDVVDVQLADVGADRPDVVTVDVPRDAGPVDGGPVMYDLEAMRAETSYRVAARETYPSGAAEDCEAPPTDTSCSVMSGTLRFSVRACGVYLTGLLPLATTTGRVVSIFAGGGGSSAATIRLASGRRIAGGPARQSFHVQVAAVPFQGEPGLSGIPGRTVDPALADLWLLGCASD
ncbi:MAG: hypothetical protein EPO40_06340 [Myxococcaceae bacterium]|nr:MAG: hypothetical protein EPO40_06340 [Myxococcaceae bacterium]